MAVSTLQKFLEKYWYSSPGPLWALYPLELLYLLGSTFNKVRSRSAEKSGLSVPVVVVGNISVGGTGKTPTLIRLIQILQAKGLKPGVVSRGFGRKHQGMTLVNRNTSWEHCGDEPRLIFDETQCPVVVFNNRNKAAAFLLENHPECDVIFADDGLQHYKLARDFEIAIVDGSRVFGNGHLLPVGPLREKPERLLSVDWVLLNAVEPKKMPPFLNIGENVFPVALASTTIQNIENSETEKVSTLTKCDFALAGIGNPLRFFSEVRTFFPNVTPIAFADHWEWTLKDLIPYSGKTVITTGKDAVKVRECLQGGNPTTAKKIDASQWWQLDVEMQLPDGFVNRLYDSIIHRGKK